MPGLACASAKDHGRVAPPPASARARLTNPAPPGDGRRSRPAAAGGPCCAGGRAVPGDLGPLSAPNAGGKPRAPTAFLQNSWLPLPKVAVYVYAFPLYFKSLPERACV